jgi:hypothetical protein
MPGDHAAQPNVLPASEVVIAPLANTPRPPFKFSREDEAFLEEVQRGAFRIFWNRCAPERGVPTGMAPDRTSKPTVSIAGVGFQLSALCVGVERGWISREQGTERATLILRSLQRNPANRKAGLFYHFLSEQDAGQPAEAYEHVVSTIDSALFFAGVLTASQYFGGEVREIGDRLFADADWAFFVAPPTAKDPQIVGFVTLGWKPADKAIPTGDGELLPYGWIDSGDEHRLVAFLGACAPRRERRLDAELYYRMRRQLGAFEDIGPVVWFPWSGALFASFFAHCWIDYAGIGIDNPAAFGVPHRARVDWWENSRRTTKLHQRKCEINPQALPGLGIDAWGLTASDVPAGYAVPGVFPTLMPMPGAQQPRDFFEWPVKDDFGDGTLAPYGAGSCIMFDPRRAIAALKHYQRLIIPGANRPLWSDPAGGGDGFQDAFNLAKGWVAEDCLAIDQGPLLLAIENARSGLLWKTFHAHPFVKEGMDRLQLRRKR